MADQSLKANNAKISARVVQFIIRTEDNNKDKALKAMDDAELYIVFFPANAFPLAKLFWQHAGMGISSRFADHCLAILSEDSSPVSPLSAGWAPLSGKVSNKHYTAKDNRSALRSETLTMDQNVYVEERYGRNLPNDSAAAAKRALRRRIADVHTKNQWHEGGNDDSRGVAQVTEDDVFLYPGGMCAIWHAHRIARATRSPAKSAAFGYVHT
jgi:cystathionine gamma-synthase